MAPVFDNPIKMIDNSPVISILALIALVTFIGNMMILPNRRGKELGWKCAGGVKSALVIYSLYSWLNIGQFDATQLVGILWRGLLAGGVARL